MKKLVIVAAVLGALWWISAKADNLNVEQDAGISGTVPPDHEANLPHHAPPDVAKKMQRDKMRAIRKAHDEQERVRAYIKRGETKGTQENP